MQKLVIIGAGGFARELTWLVEEKNKVHLEYELLALLDEDSAKEGRQCLGVKVHGELKEAGFFGETPIYALISTGKAHSRAALEGKVKSAGYRFTRLISPTATVSDYAHVGEGSIVMPGSVVTVEVSLGRHILINKLCSIGHESRIGDYCTIAPGAKIGGRVVLEEKCDIGMNASVIQGVKIGRGTTVGAGAVVTGDLPPDCVAVGVPARVIKNKNSGSAG